MQVPGFLERETGIEPATNSLEGCDSTIELLPPAFISFYTALLVNFTLAWLWYSASNATHGVRL